jgi:hypothetical protein
MIRRHCAVLALLAATLMAGCATRTPQAFEKADERLTPSSPPVYLMTATIKNDYKSYYEPRLLVVNVEKAGAKDSADRLNFTMDAPAKYDENDKETGNSYLLRLPLPSGQYELVGLTSLSQRFPINGTFFTPLHHKLDVKAGGVYYLGHVNATVRERQGNEFKAGVSIPLIDQAVAGASTGTWDVEIVDAWATDEALFRARFPALKDAAITKAVLPAWDRAVAQAWWEAH